MNGIEGCLCERWPPLVGRPIRNAAKCPLHRRRKMKDKDMVQEVVQKVDVGQAEKEAALAQAVFEGLECKDPLTRVFIKYLLGLARLFDSKQLDYGPRNISEFGEPGVVVLMNDKFARIKNLLFPGGVFNPTPPANESTDDTYQDVASYAVIALMVRHGRWPGA